jgi:hypothetical protein
MEKKMTAPRSPAIRITGKQRLLNVVKDSPDLRDRWYEPSLVQLKPRIDNSRYAVIRDQGEEGACTGFGLAAAIDILNRKNGLRSFRASPRMLYELARHHDEWPGQRYAGSSCRGAIKGWKNMGVCKEAQWPFLQRKPGSLTVERAIAARDNTLGAYYRLRPDVNDYHAALNEVDAIYVSADVHAGWWAPKARRGDKLAVIQPAATTEGGHAFCIVGYNEQGFLVQNSWGPKWGSGGIALWRYEDWIDNVSDGWVFRLAIPTPTIFGLSARGEAQRDAEFFGRAPKRIEIAGHFIHFDDGKLEAKGDYWSDYADLRGSAERIRDLAGKYPHLLVYAHGGLNSPKASASRIAALKEGFKRNGIYPLHMMYDTGIGEELKDAVTRAISGRKAENFLSDLRDAMVERSDVFIEDVVRKPVTPLWDEMKRGARQPWVPQDSGQPADGAAALELFAGILRESGVRIHLAGHSTGAILLGHLLGAFDRIDEGDLVASCTLLAPACSIAFFNEHYRPRLGKDATAATRLPALDVYNLRDALELADSVGPYRKSLLYLVSHALERTREQPLLGMEKHAGRVGAHPGLQLHYSDGSKGSVTRSTTHGGFDNDVFTMNSLLARILGAPPVKPFTAAEMKGY